MVISCKIPVFLLKSQLKTILREIIVFIWQQSSYKILTALYNILMNKFVLNTIQTCWTSLDITVPLWLIFVVLKHLA